MNNKASTKDLNDNLSDRQILLELRQVVGVLVERVTELEKRTNPLPPNYDARFTALEDTVKSYDARFSIFERSVMALERSQQELIWGVKGIREDLERERQQRFTIEDRIDRLERRAA